MFPSFAANVAALQSLTQASLNSYRSTTEDSYSSPSYGRQEEIERREMEEFLDEVLRELDRDNTGYYGS